MQRKWLFAALAACFIVAALTAHAETFNYHGSLLDAGEPANGNYDFRLTLYASAEGSQVIAGPVTLYGVQVRGGNFATEVDFGSGVQAETQSWLNVEVSPAGTGSFANLSARSSVVPEGGSCPGAWTLDGNAGNPVGSYIGTADTNPVYIEANNTVAAGVTFNPDTTLADFYTYGATGFGFPYPANGRYSIAAGYNGGTNNDGSFVFGGYSDSFGTNVRDSATNQFIVAAAHGVGINTGLAVNGGPLLDELTIAPSPDLPGGNADITFATAAGTTGYNGFNLAAEPTGYLHLAGLYWDGTALAYDTVLFVNYIHSAPGYAYWNFNGANSFNAITVGTNASSGNGAYLTTTGVWTNASSRTFKEGFAAIDPLAVLDKLVALPVTSWYYKGNREDGLHMGPVAEDFARSFGLGNNDRYIGTVDEQGVAFAAIKGLNSKLETANAALRSENAELRSLINTIAARLAQLERRAGE